MFPKKLRLPKTATLTGSKIIHTSSFTLRCKQNELEYNRYGFVISKKVSKLAVARNSLRRRFRTEIEQKQEQLAQGYDMLFVLKPEALHKEPHELIDHLETTLKKNKLL